MLRMRAALAELLFTGAYTLKERNKTRSRLDSIELSSATILSIRHEETNDLDRHTAVGLLRFLNVWW